MFLLPLFPLAIGMVHAAPAATWFYPGSGPEIAVLEADGKVSGVPVKRTGALVAKLRDPHVLDGLSGVVRVEALRGDGRVVRIQVAPGVDELALSRKLHDQSNVVWSHPDFAIHPVLAELPDDPFVADQWHLENTGQQGWTPDADIDAETAWALSTGEGQLIAIIDTGVDLDHPDLDVISGWDYADDDAFSDPDSSYEGWPHGTCTAGLAAAIGGNGVGVAGVAWNAQIYAIRFLDDSTTLSDMRDAFVEAVDAGATVLSNSWGFGDSCKPFPTYGSISDAVDYAEEQGRGGLGAAVVVAAGNGNCDMSGDGLQAPEPVISVAAINGDDVREWYSSFGDLMDISAPAGGVLTTDFVGDEGYGSWQGNPDYWGGMSGTSAATPIVAGTLALMFAANPRLTAKDAREVLCETADRIDVENGAYDDTGWSRIYGCGRVNAGAAVLAVANEAPAAPAPLLPQGEATAGRVLLAWNPAVDADNDWLDYEVTWWIGDDVESGLHKRIEGTSLDLSQWVVVGDVVSWQVQAFDLWGAGATSDVQTFEILDEPVADQPVTPPSTETPSGCDTSTSGPGSWSVLSLFLAFKRRCGRGASCRRA